MRAVALGMGLIGALLVGVAVAGLVARQLGSAPTPSPVAIASPSPVPTAAPTPTPTAIDSPTVQPSASASPSASPTPAASTAAPIPTSTELDPATAEEFAEQLAAAINGADSDYLSDRLHPAVIERYGGRQCRNFVTEAVAGDEVEWEILGSSGPEPWPYVTDERETVIDDAWAVSVRQLGADPEMRELHFAPSNGLWRWFSDCGAPRPGGG